MVVNNPYDNLDFLFKATKEEVESVVRGIDALANTINWELVSESAVGMVKIEELARTMRLPVSEMVTYEEYNKTPVEKITKHKNNRKSNTRKN